MPDRKLAYASTGDVMAAMSHRDTCVEAQNLTSETLDIIVVLRMAFSDPGPLVAEEKDAALAVLSIAEARARAAHVAAKAVAQATEEALRV